MTAVRQWGAGTWVLAGLVGLALTITFRVALTNPVAAIARVSSASATAASLRFAKALGLPAPRTRPATFLSVDRLTLAQPPRTPAEASLVEHRWHVWTWVVTWAAPPTYVAMNVDVDRPVVVGFFRTGLSSVASAALGAPAAERLARAFLHRVGVPLHGLTLRDVQHTQLAARRDWRLAWQRTPAPGALAAPSVVVVIQGSRVAGFSEGSSLPGLYRASPPPSARAGAWALIPTGLAVVLAIVLGIGGIGAALSANRRGAEWRWAGALAVVAGVGAGVAVTGVASSTLPVSPVEQLALSTSVFITPGLLITVLPLVLLGLFTSALVAVIVVVAAVAGRSLASSMWGEKVPVLSGTADARRGTTRRGIALRGTCLGAWCVGLTVLAIAASGQAGTRAANGLSSGMPTGSLAVIVPLATVVSAAAAGEVVFRLLAVSLAARWTRRAWAGVVLAALFWALTFGPGGLRELLRLSEAFVVAVSLGVGFAVADVETAMVAQLWLTAALVAAPWLNSAVPTLGRAAWVAFAGPGLVVALLLLWPSRAPQLDGGATGEAAPNA